jgi:hypothetical protein
MDEVMMIPALSISERYSIAFDRYTIWLFEIRIPLVRIGLV